MNKHKDKIGLILGIIVLLIIWNLKIEGLTTEGQRGLSLSLMTVIFWATKVSHSGFVAGLYLVSLVLFEIAPLTDIFMPWTQQLIYLIIGAYLIASSVKSSGLGERIAYKFILKFGNSYKNTILSIFGLTFILSLLIPHPWPRAFIIMSVIHVVINSADLPEEDGAILGFAVFVASVPISMIFLTGDSSINILAVEFSGVKLSWLGWLYQMGIPATFASILTCLLFLKIFKINSDFNINKTKIRNKLKNLGPLSQKEKKTIFWLVLAIMLWMTDSIHGIDLGWVTLTIAMLMSFPIIGGVISSDDWKQVPIEVLIFLTAAIAIGNVGSITGMNSWIAEQILPASMPENILFFALLVSTVSIFLHMILGSVIAAMGVVIPTFIAFTSGNASINPLVPALLAYTSIALHYILPFHHISILVGLGENNGLYTDKFVRKLGIPLTFIVYIIVIFQVIWWSLTGLI